MLQRTRSISQLGSQSNSGVSDCSSRWANAPKLTDNLGNRWTKDSRPSPHPMYTTTCQCPLRTIVTFPAGLLVTLRIQHTWWVFFSHKQWISDRKIAEFHSSAKKSSARTPTCAFLRRRRGGIHTRTAPRNTIRQQSYLPSQGITRKLHYIRPPTRPRYCEPSIACRHYGPVSWRRGDRPPSLLVCKSGTYLPCFRPVHRSSHVPNQDSTYGRFMAAVVWTKSGVEVRLGYQTSPSSGIPQFRQSRCVWLFGSTRCDSGGTHDTELRLWSDSNTFGALRC